MVITSTRIFSRFNTFTTALVGQVTQSDPTVMFAYSKKILVAARGDVGLAEKCLRSTLAVAPYPLRFAPPNFLLNVETIQPRIVLHLLRFERKAPESVRARVLDFGIICNYLIDNVPYKRSHKITAFQLLDSPHEYEIPAFRKDNMITQSEVVLVRYFESNCEGKSYHWIFKNNIPKSKYMYSLNRSKLSFFCLGNIFVLDLVSGFLTRIYRLRPTDMFCQFVAPNKVLYY